MALDVEMEARPDYLLVSVTGEYDMFEAIDRFAEVILTCRQHQLSKVIIYSRDLQGEMAKTQEILYAIGIGEMHQQHLATGGTPLRVAYVGKDLYIRSWVPGRDVARDYNLDVFPTADLSEAIDWLSRQAADGA